VLKSVEAELVADVTTAVTGASAREEVVAAAVRTLFDSVIANGPARFLVTAAGVPGEPAAREAINATWGAVARAGLHAVTGTTSRGDLGVLSTVVGVGFSVVLRSPDLPQRRAWIERAPTDMVWSGISGTLGGLERAALIELDEGHAGATEGHRHLIQQVVSPSRSFSRYPCRSTWNPASTRRGSKPQCSTSWPLTTSGSPTPRRP
jgi:hypothetical protein